MAGGGGWDRSGRCRRGSSPARPRAGGGDWVLDESEVLVQRGGVDPDAAGVLPGGKLAAQHGQAAGVHDLVAGGQHDDVWRVEVPGEGRAGDRAVLQAVGSHRDSLLLGHGHCSCNSAPWRWWAGRVQSRGRCAPARRCHQDRGRAGRSRVGRSREVKRSVTCPFQVTSGCSRLLRTCRSLARGGAKVSGVGQPYRWATTRTAAATSSHRQRPTRPLHPLRRNVVIVPLVGLRPKCR
jgi:hypothetical protein